MREADLHADVLIVIPCLNEAAHLPGLLEMLLRDAHGALIVVADGGSSDGSQKVVAAIARANRNLRLLHNSRRVQSAAVNLAARRFGKGRRWLLRIDAHAAYPPNFVTVLRETAERMHATSVVVPMVTQGRACFQKAAAAAQNSVLGTGGAPHRHLGEGRWVDHGHHALFDLALFATVGGYDESFVCNEDSELDRRLVKAGGGIWLEPGAAIVYFPRRTIVALFTQYRKYGLGRARNMRRHPVPVKLRQMLPLGVAPAIVTAVGGAALAPQWPEALLLAIPALTWAGGCLTGGALLGWRQKSWCAAASGIAAMAMHAGWSLGFIAETVLPTRLPPPPEPLSFEPEPGSDSEPVKTGDAAAELVTS